jgi:hypothetical protein
MNSLTSLVTRIRNDRDCEKGNSSQIAACQGASGSTMKYAPDFLPRAPSIWNTIVLTSDPAPEDVTLDQGITQIQLDNGPQLELPLEIWTNPGLDLEATNKSFLAFGPQSSFQWTLLKDGKIPSNFTGYDHGSRSFAKPADGEAVIGGWNKAQVNGTFSNFTIGQYRMPIPCALVVKVMAFTLNNDLGSFPMIDRDRPMLACVDPMQNAITLPTSVFHDKWAPATEWTSPPGGPKKTGDYQIYSKEQEHLLGSLTIELEGGYKSEIPHHELVNPQRGAVLNSNGQYGVLNQSVIQSAVNSGLTDYGLDFGILLGGAFLSSSYLAVNWDERVFSLAPSMAHDQVGQSEILTVCSKDLSSQPSTGNLTTSGTATPNAGLSLGNKLEIGLGIGISIPSLIMAILTFVWTKRHGDSLGNTLKRLITHLHNNRPEDEETAAIEAENESKQTNEYTEFRSVGSGGENSGCACSK